MRRPLFHVVFSCLAACILTCAASRSALACIGAISEPMPVCVVSAPLAGEKVVIIETESEVPTNLRFGADGPTAMLTEVEIAAGSGPLNLVLSHSYPVIFQFTGAVSEIARVTAMGSAYDGPDFYYSGTIEARQEYLRSLGGGWKPYVGRWKPDQVIKIDTSFKRAVVGASQPVPAEPQMTPEHPVPKMAILDPSKVYSPLTIVADDGPPR